MRTLFPARVVLVALSLLGCSGSPPGDGPLGVSRSPIAYGSSDTTHTAVVAVLAPAGSNEAGIQIEECTGTIVQVSGTVGYVLTAAHCCNVYVPTVVVISNDYSSGEPYLLPDAGAPKAPAYPVVPGSVQFDPMYATSNPPDHDFCMLKFSGATASTPTIALPTSTNDGLALGSRVQHVGFGVTQTGAPNSVRMAGTDTVTGPLTSGTLQFAQGGDADIPGTCDGDSGGPSLLPASASQAQQVVVGVQSYGNSTTTCVAETLGVASRVSSAIGPGGFITSYLPAAAPPAAVPAASRLQIAILAFGLFVIGSGCARSASSRNVNHVKRLRDKLGTAGRFIQTVGYRFSEIGSE